MKSAYQGYWVWKKAWPVAWGSNRREDWEGTKKDWIEKTCGYKSFRGMKQEWSLVIALIVK